MSELIIEVENLAKQFSEGKLHVDVLNNINFTIKAGETAAIVGRSGSGKSTLLHLLGGLDKPSSGSVKLQGLDYKNLSEKALCQLRNEKLGFIYQFHHLLPEFTALQNVAMPLLIRGDDKQQALATAAELLTKINLGQRLEHKIAELSGGERQRVAIARALVTKPSCVLADEPTGNLDTQTAEQVFNEMLELNNDLKTSLIIVTHDNNLANKMSKQYLLDNKNLTII